MCNLPKDERQCKEAVTKWYYDAEEGSCVRFWFGGCSEKGNHFDTEEACASMCKYQSFSQPRTTAIAGICWKPYRMLFGNSSAQWFSYQKAFIMCSSIRKCSAGWKQCVKCIMNCHWRGVNVCFVSRPGCCYREISFLLSSEHGKLISYEVCWK